MHIEIDVSGKIEHTKSKSIIAYSSSDRECQRAICLPATLKRIIYSAKKKRSKKNITLNLFAICIFYLIKSILPKIDFVLIDEEYVGHAPAIKAKLLSLIRLSKFRLRKEQIHFVNVGKKSPAHVKAIRVFRNQQLADKTLSFKDIEKCMKI